MKTLFVLVSLFAGWAAKAHPTGNIVHTGDYLVWSYVCPVGSAEHRACLMTWAETRGVKPWLVSKHSGSDWMISKADSAALFLVERYFEPDADKHRFRVLLAKPPDCNVTEVIAWMPDEQRFGEGGFVALEDGSFLFARYPTIYRFRPDGRVEPWAAWKDQDPVLRISKASDRHIAILSSDQAWLANYDGEVVKQWSELLNDSLKKLPFMGNRVFDLAHGETGLWLAYWGGRRLDVISSGKRKTVVDFATPYLPHAVTVNGEIAYVLASSIDPGSGLSILPLLYAVRADSTELIWRKSGKEFENLDSKSTAGCSAIVK